MLGPRHAEWVRAGLKRGAVIFGVWSAIIAIAASAALVALRIDQGPLDWFDPPGPCYDVVDPAVH